MLKCGELIDIFYIYFHIFLKICFHCALHTCFLLSFIIFMSIFLNFLVWCEFLVFFGEFSRGWSEKHEFSEINYSFSRNSKSLVHVFGKNSQRNLGTVAYFRDKKVFSDRFFGNFSKNMKLVIKLCVCRNDNPNTKEWRQTLIVFQSYFYFYFLFLFSF
jgi:hypothetical protein